MKKITALALMTVAFLAHSVWAGKFTIDPAHSEVAFKVKHMMISKVQGHFDKFQGEFYYDEKDVKAWKANASIESASINTNNAMRDKDLRGPDFLYVDTYPAIAFASTGVSDLQGNKAKLQGLLSIHGVQKPVTLDLEIGGVVSDPWGNARAGFEANTVINRKDFGIIWNKLLGNGGLVVGEDVEINIRVEGIGEKVPEMKPAETKMDQQKTAEKKPKKKEKRK